MNSLQTIAIAKLVKDAAEKSARKELKVGTHKVDFVVHVLGEITVGADYSQNIVAKAEPWRLLAVALSKLNGVTVDSLVRESLNGTIDGDSVKESADNAIAAIKADTLGTCKGKVTTVLTTKVLPKTVVT